MHTVKFLSTDGPYLEARVEVSGVVLHIFDEFSVDENAIPKPGTEFSFSFSTWLDEDESWEDIFSGNPEKKLTLQHLSGWSYRAFGVIVSINPVIADCGLIDVEGVIQTNDPRVIGEFVAFSITRLGGGVGSV